MTDSPVELLAQLSQKAGYIQGRMDLRSDLVATFKLLKDDLEAEKLTGLQVATVILEILNASLEKDEPEFSLAANEQAS